MGKLTEDMVIARSKGSELHNIKKLNCWGSELTDVSVVRHLPNVEVLSLSVNQISTLEDFQHCPNLQEMYVRKNNITDINEVLYLKNIPKLKSLWLADNPCANFDQYRMTVLRALPHLQKLDNVAVENEEVQRAMVCGLHLPLPDSHFRTDDHSEMVRSNSVGDSLKSESRCGSGASLSDSSPTTLPTNRSETEPTKKYSECLEEGFEYTQNVFDEDEEQPQMRRSSQLQAVHRDPQEMIEKRSSTHNYPQSNVRGSKYYDHEYPEYEDDRRSVQSSNSYGVPNVRRLSYSKHPHQHLQSPPHHRPVQVATPDSESRPFSRSSSDYGYNNNSVGHHREEAYPPTRYSKEILSPTANNHVNEKNNNVHNKSSQPPSRRVSREHYREQSWASDADGYPRERAYVTPPENSYRSRDSYAGRPTGEYRTSSGDKWHFGPRPSSVGEVLQNHYENTYRKVDHQIETATRVTNSVEKTSPNRPYPIRPKTRNGNVLSAVLCLIKELDYSSLEVVEMAIRCRMDELED